MTGRWYCHDGGLTNLCHNIVSEHAPMARGNVVHWWKNLTGKICDKFFYQRQHLRSTNFSFFLYWSWDLCNRLVFIFALYLQFSSLIYGIYLVVLNGGAKRWFITIILRADSLDLVWFIESLSQSLGFSLIKKSTSLYLPGYKYKWTHSSVSYFHIFHLQKSPMPTSAVLIKDQNFNEKIGLPNFMYI